MKRITRNNRQYDLKDWCDELPANFQPQRQPVQKPPLLVELFGGGSEQVLKYENLKGFILVFTQTLVVCNALSPPDDCIVEPN